MSISQCWLPALPVSVLLSHTPPAWLGSTQDRGGTLPATRNGDSKAASSSDQARQPFLARPYRLAWEPRAHFVSELSTMSPRPSFHRFSSPLICLRHLSPCPGLGCGHRGCFSVLCAAPCLGSLPFHRVSWFPRVIQKPSLLFCPSSPSQPRVPAPSFMKRSETEGEM